MIWRWLIFFSLMAAGTCQAAMVCGKAVLRDSRLEDVKKRGNYSGVVISLAPLAQAAAATPPRHCRMLQKDKTFTPHILPILAGSIVDFPNADPIFHSAFSSYSGQIFDVGLYPPGETRSVRFKRPGIVRVFCNIHPTMSAVIVVLTTPYFATTQADGSFRIEAPPGDYTLNIFHERATQATLNSLSRRITVQDTVLELPEIVISESGFVATPHKNKFGKDYPPGSGDDAVYPGARK
jgi:plastocyanin